MRKNKSNVTKILILYFFLLFALTGCLGGREINDLEIVIGMGVDKDENTGDILLTAQIVKEEKAGTSSGSENGGDSKAYWNVSSSGNSIFDAARKITQKTGNRLFVSHNQIVIFSNDIAEEGLYKYIDFFLRAHEMRPTALILVAEDRASDIMDSKPATEKYPAMNMAKLVKSYGFTSNFYNVNMKDFASYLMSTTKAPIAPLVSVTQDMECKDTYVSGMAVFKKGKMVGKLNNDEARGLLWVLGKVKSGVILVPSPGQQGYAILEIIKSKSKVTPEVNGNRIVMNIRIIEESSLSEQTTTEDLATIPAFENIQKDTAVIIRQEIMMAFEKSKELNADIFGFGEMIHKKYKKEWKSLEDKWEDIYPTIELNIDIETKLIKTDLLRKPALPTEEEY